MWGRLGRQYTVQPFLPTIPRGQQWEAVHLPGTKCRSLVKPEDLSEAYRPEVGEGAGGQQGAGPGPACLMLAQRRLPPLCPPPPAAPHQLPAHTPPPPPPCLLAAQAAPKQVPRHIWIEFCRLR